MRLRALINVMAFSSVALQGSTVLSATSETEAAKLQPPFAVASDMAGTSVAIDGDLMVVGVPHNDMLGVDAGAVAIYQWNGYDWNYQGMAVSPSPVDNEYFGAAVAINDNVVAIGAPGNSDLASNAGAVYVYAWDELGFELNTTLYDGAPGADHSFGSSLSMSDAYLVAGAPYANNIGVQDGTASIFEWSGAWVLAATLQSPIGDDFENTGHSVALTETSSLGEMVILGAPGAANQAGLVYAFFNDSGLWEHAALFESGDPNSGYFFGSAVAIDGDMVVIGEPNSDEHAVGAGQVWVYQYTPGIGFVPIANLEPLSLSANDQMGTSVAIEETKIAVGIPRGAGLGPNSGRVDLWDLNSSGIFDHELEYAGRDISGAATGGLGSSVAISEGIVIAGAPIVDSEAGAAYLFSNYRAWITLGSGEWLDTINWTGGRFPDWESIVYFGIDDTFTVEVDGGNAESLSMLIHEGDVTITDTPGWGSLIIHPGGQGLTVASSVPGETSSLLLEHLSLASSETTFVGGETGGDGILEISDCSGDFGNIIVGSGAAGGMRITSASLLTCDGIVIIGDKSGSEGNLTLASASALWINSVLAGATDLEIQHGEVSLDDLSELESSTLIDIGSKGILSGNGTVTTQTITNRGRVIADATGGATLTLAAEYYQANESPSGAQENGLLIIENLAAGEIGISIGDTGVLNGGCIVGADDPDNLQLGDMLNILTSTIVEGDFSVWFVPAVGTDYYLDPYAALRGAGDVSLEVKELGASFGFNSEVSGEGDSGGPVAMIVEDIDGDTVDDIVVAVSTLDTLDVWLNDGNGTLCLDSRTSLPSAPSDMTAADFDQDGDIDLAITQPLTDQALVYLNDGLGGFSLGATLTTGDQPEGITAFSLNGDNLPDLAVTNFNDDTISTFENTTTLLPLGFGLQSVVNTVSKPKPISPGGLGTGSNKDDDLIVVGDEEGGAHENDGLGLGIGAVTTFATGGTPVDLAVLDLNDDGYDDVAVSLTGGDSLSVIINDTNGDFDPAVLNASPHNGGELAVGDLDDDGDEDLLLVEIDPDSADESVVALRNDAPSLARSRGQSRGCPPGEIEDCNGNCAPDTWIGDGWCDDGSFDWNGIPIFFNCDEFNCDGGDCICGSSRTPAMLAESLLATSRGILAGTRILGAGDIDADGTTDVVQIQESGADYVISVQTSIASDPWDPDTCCEGDLDGSGAVDVDDLLSVISAWGACPDPSDCPSDLDGNGEVDVNDLLAVIGAFGPC
ncbi:MAG: FG-GAP-like repeat-containing protein [Phycisphaerales bacterium]|nr:FG-GAP-like repeat-containing protein [Phycisphaerales bacterium]